MKYLKILYLELCNFNIIKAQTVSIFGYDEFQIYCIVIVYVHIA